MNAQLCALLGAAAAHRKPFRKLSQKGKKKCEKKNWREDTK